ncbi:MAG: helix-turn-helix domain-containing protein [Pseudohongiellaceae bacterium]
MPTEASSETAPEESLAGGAADNISPLSPGQMLSAARVQQNLTQREVAETLHITMHYVNEIEHDEHDKLPGAVFAKGYIKRYAEIMALDETAVMVAYEGLGYASPAAIAGTGRNTRKPRRVGKSLWAVAASAAVFFSLFLGLWAWSGKDANTPAGSLEPALSESPESSGPAQPLTAMPAAPADSDSASRRAAAVVRDPLSLPLASPQQATVDGRAVSGSVNRAEIDEGNASGLDSAEPATVVEGEGKDTLKLSFSGTSWIEVRDSGDGDRYRELRMAGDVLEIKGVAPFDVFLGDAPRIRLSLNGNDIDLSQEPRIDNSVQLTVGL